MADMCKGNYAHHVKEKMFRRFPEDMELQSLLPLAVLTIHNTPESVAPDYVCQRKGIVCQRKGIENTEPICQRVSGAEVDRFVADLPVEFIIHGSSNSFTVLHN